MARIVILLMPWGRVGSNLVNGVVLRAKSLRVFNEPLTGIQTRTLSEGGRLEDVWANQEGWIEDNMLARPQDMFLNLAANSIMNPARFRDLVAPLCPRYLILDRQDDAAVAVSALRTEEWVAEGAANGEKRTWSIPRGLAVQFRPYISPARLLAARNIIRRGRDNIGIICSSGLATRYYYEDIILDMRGVISDILVKSGIPAYDFQVVTEKFGSPRLEDMVANAAELGEVIRSERISTSLVLP